MSSPINVTAALIADAMGVLILICVIVGNLFIIKEQSKRNKYFVILVFITICSCVLDGILSVVDGKNRTAVLISNTLTYICGPATAITWILLIAKSIKIKISKIHKIIVWSFFFASVGMILANMFTPILFTVNEYNVYERVDGLYLVYAMSYFGILADAVVMYILKKHDSGGIKFFPMWAFVSPIALGMIIQNFFFGVSTIAPFMTISITSLAISFQNSLLYKDQLTDLYNRYYLATLEKRLIKKSGKKYSIIMLDINDFKSINDIYGHEAGDEALMHLSRILVSVVDKTGEVIRYAGDEFIIVLNSREDGTTEALISQIHQSLKEFSASKVVPYELSVAVGFCGFSFEKTLNAFITEADRRMYADKQKYYKLHPKQSGDLK